MTSIVVDMDGTLSNCKHRQHHAEQGQWDEFHSKLSEDKTYYDVQWLLERLPDSIQVIVLTGRNETYRSKTFEWLSDKGIFVDMLLRRPDGDFRPDHELKPKLLEEAFGSKDLVIDNVMFVLDDRDKVVEAWRNYGLDCWQVRPEGY